MTKQPPKRERLQRRESKATNAVLASIAAATLLLGSLAVFAPTVQAIHECDVLDELAEIIDTQSPPDLGSPQTTNGGEVNECVHLPFGHLIDFRPGHSATSFTIPQRTEVTLTWAIEIVHGLNGPLLPVDVEAGKATVSNSDLCQVGSPSSSSDSGGTVVVPYVTAGLIQADEDSYDDNFRLYPDHFQVIHDLGLGRFPQKALIQLTIFADSTSETYKQPYSCEITVPLVAVGMDGQEQNMILEGLIEAIPQPDFQIPMGECNVVANTIGTCQSTTASEFGGLGSYSNPLVLVGTREEANLTVATALDYQFSREGGWTTEWYFLQYFNKDACAVESSALHKEKKLTGVGIQNFQATTQLEDSTQTQAKTGMCYTAEVWEDDPGDRHDNFWSDDDDLEQRVSFESYFRYEQVDTDVEIEGLPISVNCQKLVAAIVGHVTPAVSDIVNCIASAGDGSDTNGGGIPTPSGVLVPVTHNGQRALLGGSIDPEVLDAAYAAFVPATPAISVDAGLFL